MPLIVNVGLPRTGTKSFARATELLGFNALHIWHRAERDPGLLAGFVANDPECRELLSGYHAVSDTPFYALRATFEEHYPGTKIVYTTRPREDWLRSMLRIGVSGGRFLADHYDMPRYPYRDRDRAELERMYDTHHERVCRDLPAIDLADPNDSAKWQVLCSGLPDPEACLQRAAGWPWPHENRRCIAAGRGWADP